MAHRRRRSSADERNGYGNGVSSSSASTPICRCRVLYLGSAVPHASKDGLQGIQEPLGELYPEEGASGVRGIDSWLSVWSNGLLLENVDERRKEVTRFFPIESLHYCAAVRHVAVPTNTSSSASTSGAVTQGQPRFLPLDSPFARNPDVAHPPLFACILRRTTGIKVLECHAFICKREVAANALVRCCFHAYADSSYAKQLETGTPGAAMSSSIYAGMNGTNGSTRHGPETLVNSFEKVAEWRTNTSTGGDPTSSSTVNMSAAPDEISIYNGDENHKVWAGGPADKEGLYLDLGGGTLRSVRSATGSTTATATRSGRPRQIMTPVQAPPPPPPPPPEEDRPSKKNHHQNNSSNHHHHMQYTLNNHHHGTTKKDKKKKGGGVDMMDGMTTATLLLPHHPHHYQPQQVILNGGMMNGGGGTLLRPGSAMGPPMRSPPHAIYAVPIRPPHMPMPMPMPMPYPPPSRQPIYARNGGPLPPPPPPMAPPKALLLPPSPPPRGPPMPHQLHPLHHRPISPMYAAHPMGPEGGPAAFLVQHYATAERRPRKKKGKKNKEEDGDGSPFGTGIYRRKGHLNERAFSYSIRQEHRSRSYGSLANLKFANGDASPTPPLQPPPGQPTASTTASTSGWKEDAKKEREIIQMVRDLELSGDELERSEVLPQHQNHNHNHTNGSYQHHRRRASAASSRR